MPSVIILNTSNEQFFLPSEFIGTMEQLVHFINSVLNGSAQVRRPSPSSVRLFANAARSNLSPPACTIVITPVVFINQACCLAF